MFRDHRLKIVARVGRPDVRDAKSLSNGSVAETKSGSHPMLSSGAHIAWATGLVANGMSPAAKKAPAAVPRSECDRASTHRETPIASVI